MSARASPIPIPIPFRASIRAKLMLVALFSVCLLGLMVPLSGVGIYQEYKAIKVRQVRNQIDLRAAELRNSVTAMRDNALRLSVIGQMMHSLARRGRHWQDVSDLGTLAVEHNMQINLASSGSGIWFAPGALYADRPFTSWLSGNRDGKPVRLSEIEAKREAASPWFAEIRKKLETAQPGQVVWGAPHFDTRTGRGMTSTAGTAIFDGEGRQIGVATVDWPLTAIGEVIDSLRPTPGSISLFVDQRHDLVLFIGQPDDREGQPVGQSLAALSWFGEGQPEEREIKYEEKTWIAFARRLENGMMVTVSVPSDELFADIHHSLWIAGGIFCVILLLSLALTYASMSRLVCRPVMRIARQAGEVGRGNLEARCALGSRDELGLLAQRFNQMADDLKRHIDEVNDMQTERQKLSVELDLAREIQVASLSSLLPALAERDEIEFYAFMLPARQVGGDLCDAFFIGRDRLAMLMADPLQTGISAALFMVALRALTRFCAAPSLLPGEILTRVNAELFAESDAFSADVALFILDLTTGEMACAGAGDIPAFIRRKDSRFAPLPISNGPRLAETPNSLYRSQIQVLAPGDAIFLCTDGVPEAANPEGEQLGLTRLSSALDAHAVSLRRNLNAFLDSVKEDIDAFARGTPPADDITMLALRYKG
ncbi:MAG: SpoIIE family protein phosphatase, partial [Zoogloeaceae bacterium]|nr:SpoIIE family protein phosphatase [Zoogloeaceae bacterium]